jgi:hypothetical protein
MQTQTTLTLTIPDIKQLVADWNRSQLQDYQRELVEFFATNPNKQFGNFLESNTIMFINTVDLTSNELIDIVRDHGHLILPAHVLKMTDNYNSRITIIIQLDNSEVILTEGDLLIL